jgi:hypothetical protein
VKKEVEITELGQFALERAALVRDRDLGTANQLANNARQEWARALVIVARGLGIEIEDDQLARTRIKVDGEKLVVEIVDEPKSECGLTEDA